MAARWIRPFAVAATLGIAGVASATHNEPISAKKLSLSLVTSYSACSGGPNTTTVLLPLPACDPPVRNDSVCGFGAKGSVKAGVSGSGATETIKFSVKAADITGCEGQTLALVASVRLTTDDCMSGGSCTVLEGTLQDFPVGLSCVVTDGKCSIKGALPTGILAPGKNTGLQLQGCALKRGSAHTFDCGLLFP